MSDPNKGVYSVLNISRIPSSLAKKMILEYSARIDEGRRFNVVFFLDEEFDDELLESFNAVFARLTYNPDTDTQQTFEEKYGLQNLTGMCGYYILSYFILINFIVFVIISIHIRFTRKRKNLQNS